MGNTWKEQIESARISGFKTAEKIIEKNGNNKLDSYRNKLINALVFRDYDRVKEIILQLSSYSGESYWFYYSFLEDAEKNKDLAFAFAAALEESYKKSDDKKVEQ